MASTSMRKDVTMAERLEIIQKVEDGVSLQQLASEYGLSKRTIQRYRKNALSIRQFSENPRYMNIKRKRASLHEDVDTHLYTWFLERQAIGDTVTDNLLQEKAKQLHEEIGDPTMFTASRGWLWRFKLKYNIHLLNADANQSDAKKFVKELSKLLVGEEIEEANIYNMHETSLMWKALPQKTLMYQEEQQVEGPKMKKDRVTVAFCANATGTHKLPPLFVHKYANPRALKHCKNLLPVVYKDQINGWISEAVFYDWYTNHFKSCVRQQHSQEHRVGKVLLLVDSFRGHMIPEELQEDSYFKLIFLPPNEIANMQPMGQGIITKCKQLFRHKLLHRVFQYGGGVKQFYVDYDIKDCMDLISEAWNKITPANIHNLWRKLFDQQPSADNLEKQDSEIITDQDSEYLENISAEEIAQWISECEKVESITKVDIKEEVDRLPDCPIDEGEIDDMFYKLAIWSETEPKFVQLHASVLIDHYNKK